ncbi:2-oxoglutarate dehydrogenase E1 [Bacillus infantis]|uniref:2-oxoglutarate dehydrogenase E1 n=1 Tax=Bacillus infantis TaxID=324767 RepID=UPI003CEE7419
MKVLTMKQPWASLFALREAEYETRTWKTAYRGALAIHTSQKIDVKACRRKNVSELLGRHGYSEENLPAGQIIAVCRLEDCFRVIDHSESGAVLENGLIISGQELYLGDYRAGCYAWQVSGMEILKEPIPAKGRLGLWEYPL